MSDPRRLAFDPAGDLEATLLRAARSRAPEAARQRAIVAATAALAASGVAAGTATAAGPLVKGALATTIHWVSIGVLGAGAVGAAVVLTRQSDSRPRVSAPGVTASVSAAVPRATAAAVATSVQVVPTAASTASASSSASMAPAPAPSSTASIAAELALLDRARAVLSSGDAPRALSILDDYGSRFPHASMTTEATVLRIEALVQAGDIPAARRVAEPFLAAHPQSPYSDRIRSLLGANP